MATYLLIHGAWHGGWCWEKVAPILRQAGHTVMAPDLPGHGQDNTPIKDINLDTYRQYLIALIEKSQTKVVLVGHSMAGMLLVDLVDVIPDAIEKLVFVAAYVPQNGQSMFDVASLQSPSRYVKLMQRDEQANLFSFEFKHMKAFSYHQCSTNEYERLAHRFRQEPLAPLKTKVSCCEHQFSRIPKHYVLCTQDRAIQLSTQQQFAKRLSGETTRLDSDHAPFYSHPESLANSILF